MVQISLQSAVVCDDRGLLLLYPEHAHQGIVSLALGPAVGDLFGTVVSAPVVDQGVKGPALFILYFCAWKKDEFDGVIDGIVYPTMVGLGFVMVENFLYYGPSLKAGLRAV